MKWSPFQAKERFKEHVAEIQTLKNSNVNKGLKLKQKTNEKIKRTILGTFSNSDSKIKEYNNGISNSLPKPSNVDDVEEEIYQKSLEFMGNFVTGLIDELETTSNMDKKNKKLEKLEKDFQTKSLEAERRKAVADTKGYGAAIEMIEILRDELKERNQLSKEITEIKKQLKGIEKFLKSHNNFKDEIEKMYMETMQSLEEKNDLESLKQRKLLKKTYVEIKNSEDQVKSLETQMKTMTKLAKGILVSQVRDERNYLLDYRNKLAQMWINVTKNS